MNLNTTHAIVIGPKQVNYCNITKKSRRNMLNSLAYYDFSFERVEELKDIMESIGDIAGRGAVLNISVLHSSVIKHIYFYKKGTTKVKTNVFRDLKNDYEIQLQDYLIDYEESELEDKIAVLVVAFPKELFNKIYYYIKNQSDFRLFALEIGMISVKRLISNVYNGNDIMLCIRMDSDFSNIFAIRNGAIIVSRELQYGFYSLAKEISQYGGINIEKSITIMENIGLQENHDYTEEELKAYNTIVSSFDKMSIEIQRTIDYLLSSQKKVGIDRIITIGSINRIKRIDVYLSKLFSISAEKLESSKLIEFDSSIDFSALKEMFYTDIVIGAAMRKFV